MILSKAIFDLQGISFTIFLKRGVWLLVLTILISACNSDQRPRFIKCGGPMNDVCPIGLFCKLDQNCGGLDRDGYCARIPESCSQEEETICGCDNKEYLNECFANTLSISTKNIGSCVKKPEIKDIEQ